MSPLAAELPFDRPAYAEALRYLGEPVVVAGRPLVLRPVPGTDAVDAFGPFPYGSPPQDADALQRALAALGVVTLTCVLRPGCDTRGLEKLDPVEVKEHFVLRRSGPTIVPSSRTRRHLRRAATNWSVELREMADAIDLADRLHRLLESRAPLSRVARVDRRHFEVLAGIEGFGCAVATAHGRDSAFLVFAETADQIHFHLTAGDEDALRDDGMYALFDFMVRTYSPTRDLYLGGLPSGPNGAGVARFKARFANARVPVSMVRLVVDAGCCSDLVARLGRHPWFPPYRDPAADQGPAMQTMTSPPVRQNG